MINNLISKLSLIFSDPDLRRKILFAAGMLILFRLGNAIPIPSVDTLRLQQFLAGNQFFGLLNIFSGGGLSNLSIFMLGVGPYITASIIMQLLTMIFPSLKTLYQEEGEAGRKKFAQYSRMLSVPLAFLQGFGLLALLKRQGVLGTIVFATEIQNVLVVTAGAVLVMWIGELITEYGISNGTSLLIFAGIVAQMPSSAGQILANFTPADIPLYLAFLVVALVIIAGVVTITEAERPVPITYAKRVRGMKVYGGVSTYLPLRVNQAGVIPIIFALSILLFPQLVASFLSGIDNAVVQKIADILNALTRNTWIYSIAYFGLVFAFTYFYTAVTFDPDAISTNLQKSGAFIPGIRPGKSTSVYLSYVLTRLTLVGALFLGLIAVLPLLMRTVTGNASLAIGGTALLIVVSVVVELIRQLDAQVSMREY